MVVLQSIQSIWLAAVTQVEPALSAIGWWTAAYLLLSLSLALIWIAVVSTAQSCRASRDWSAGHTASPRTATLALGFRHWQERGGDAFVTRLESFSARPRAS
jgi:hypothetical protein